MPGRCLLRPSEDGRAGEGRREREEAYHPGNEGVKTAARYGAAIYSTGWIKKGDSIWRGGCHVDEPHACTDRASGGGRREKR